MAAILKALVQDILREVDKLDDAAFDPVTGALRHDAGFKSPASDAVELARALHFALMGPMDVIHLLTDGVFDLAALQVLHRFKVWEALPMDSEAKSYDDLAGICGLDTSMLKRVTRMAITNGIFREPAPGRLMHTTLSRCLREEAGMKNLVDHICDEALPAAACFADAVELYNTGSTDPTASAWCIANDATHPMMEELQLKYPVRFRQFFELMAHWHSDQQPISLLVDNFDWASLGKAQVVDVGGGMGQVSIALAKAFPDLSFVVQDFEPVIKEARAALDAGLVDRVKCVKHDFFDQQPVTGAAVYLFRSIFHNWSDKNAVRILKQLVPALRPGCRIVINDSCMLPPGELSILEERQARTIDLAMATLHNAKERELNEWAPLFHQADSRYRLTDIKTPVINKTGVPQRRLLKIIEVVWEES